MTGAASQYFVVLFKSVSHVMHAERILKEAHVPHKIIPVPRVISSECGVCIRLLPENREGFESILIGKIEGFEIRKL
jgi:hypothetical protein